jgi:CHAD domain-containing protein
MAKPLKIKNVLPDSPMQKAAVRILRRRLKEFYSHWPDSALTPTHEQLHNMRISCKRLRYSAESLRDFYPDRLALLIDLLKRSQDLLGEIQDCVTQRAIIEEDLQRLRKRNPQSSDIAVLDSIIADYQTRYGLLFTPYREIWQGMRNVAFRKCLKKMSTGPHQPHSAGAEAPIHLIIP